MIRLALLLSVLLVAPCFAAGSGGKLMFSGKACVSSGHTTAAINGISSLAQSGTTDTGTQTVSMSCGAITAAATCYGEDEARALSAVYLVVDGVTRDSLTCGRLATSSKTLTVSVPTGSHTVRVYGTATNYADGGQFTANTFSIPVP